LLNLIFNIKSKDFLILFFQNNFINFEANLFFFKKKYFLQKYNYFYKNIILLINLNILKYKIRKRQVKVNQNKKLALKTETLKSFNPSDLINNFFTA
jgi:uncharacterized membrane protein